ncbi:MAG TPA: ABC transporter substrate-binding protein [Kiloniellales bacterium]|jgi:putative spermidine/putrescine transport system substrate-binding protein|nr:ABC transporter substrate-binding protein [Kiloniellales bacterium]
MRRFTGRSLALGGTILAIGLAVALPGEAEARPFTVTSWGGNYQDAQREIYFEPYKEETGNELFEDVWNGGVGAIRAKVEGGASDWDVVQVEVEELVIGCEEGLYELLDWDQLGLSGKLIPGAEHECGAGTIVWSTVLAYDGDVLSEGPASWADFWDVEKFPGKRALRRGPQYSLEFALQADGVPVNEVYDVLGTDEGVDRAFAKLDEIKDHIVWWEAGAQPLQLLASGEVVMTSAYNGRLTGANQTEGRNFQIVWPGSLYSIDYWVILAGSPHIEQGHEFIAFASDPSRQAGLPQRVPYGVTHVDAAAGIPEDVLPDVPTAPENLEVAAEINTEFWVDNIERLTERFNSWIAQ